MPATAMAILSHPFRLTPSGQVATVFQDTPEANAEQVAILALTKTGERPLVPAFGITDPAFRRVEPAELAAGVAAYGPPVTLRRVDVRPLNDSTTAVDVEFE